MTNIVQFKNSHEAPKSRRSVMDTWLLNIRDVEKWPLCPGQRPLRVNEKVIAISEKMKQNGVEINGVITLGKIGKDMVTLYIVDGQHRLKAFKMSGLEEIIADVRIVHYEDDADCAEDFVLLQTPIVRMNPDDKMRGLELSVQSVATIRKHCNFVGYDNVRRTGSTSPVLSMSAVLRSWSGANNETPAFSSGRSAEDVARSIEPASVEQLLQFLNIAYAAWGRDQENFRLWGNLNLCMTMWMWRQLVLNRERAGNKRYVVLTAAQFKQCLMTLSASHDYADWLVGRQMCDRDRSPCYTRIKALFVKRLREGGDKKAQLPQPSWGS